MLTRKAIERVDYAIRTANRHRCSGRVDQGVRVILRQGTRQYSDRNFGIRSAPSLCMQSVRNSLYLCIRSSVPVFLNGNKTRQNLETNFSLQRETNHIGELTHATHIFVCSVTGPQLRSPCNCLPKTQVSANTKVDV